jgi:hypothetical protein
VVHVPLGLFVRPLLDPILISERNHAQCDWIERMQLLRGLGADARHLRRQLWIVLTNGPALRLGETRVSNQVILRGKYAPSESVDDNRIQPPALS